MNHFLKICRTSALAVMMVPLLAQVAQAQTIAVKWNIKNIPGIRCIKVSNLPQNKNMYTKAYGVNPLNGTLLTNQVIRSGQWFSVDLYKRPDCTNAKELDVVKSEVYKAGGVNTTVGSKYIYGYL